MTYEPKRLPRQPIKLPQRDTKNPYNAGGIPVRTKQPVLAEKRIQAVVKQSKSGAHE